MEIERGVWEEEVRACEKCGTEVDYGFHDCFGTNLSNLQAHYFEVSKQLQEQRQRICELEAVLWAVYKVSQEKLPDFSEYLEKHLK